MLSALIFSLVVAGPECCNGMTAYLSDPAFIASHPLPLPLHWKAKEGSMLTYKARDGKTTSGFFVPANAGNTMGVVMIHEWWGLNDYIKREAERLHDELGAAVLAVDLYGGKVAATSQEASALVRTVQEPDARAVLGGAIDALKARKTNEIGTIGWCFGGGWSHRAAIIGGKDVKACVMFYGSPSLDAGDLNRLNAPVMMFWGTQDANINSALVNKFTSAMRMAGKPLATFAYEAPHGFANPSNPKFNQAAADDSHAKVLDFFKERLK